MKIPIIEKTSTMTDNSIIPVRILVRIGKKIEQARNNKTPKKYSVLFLPKLFKASLMGSNCLMIKFSSVSTISSKSWFFLRSFCLTFWNLIGWEITLLRLEIVLLTTASLIRSFMWFRVSESTSILYLLLRSSLILVASMRNLFSSFWIWSHPIKL